MAGPCRGTAIGGAVQEGACRDSPKVDPAANEPAAFDFFLWIYTMAAVDAALLLCLVAEVVLRLTRRRSHSSQ